MKPDSFDKLRPATPEEIASALAFGLQWDGRKRIHRGDAFMAELMAEHLVAYLERSNFIVMKRATGPGDNSTHYNYSSPPEDGGQDNF